MHPPDENIETTTMLIDILNLDNCKFGYYGSAITYEVFITIGILLRSSEFRVALSQARLVRNIYLAMKRYAEVGHVWDCGSNLLSIILKDELRAC